MFIAGDDALNASNMYAYCNGNPVRYADYTGELIMGLIFTGVIAAAALVSVIKDTKKPEEPKPPKPPVTPPPTVIASPQVATRPALTSSASAAAASPAPTSVFNQIFKGFAEWLRGILAMIFNLQPKPYIWPVYLHSVSTRGEWGWRKNNNPPFHYGIDVPVPKGTRVNAMATCTIDVFDSWKGAGKYLQVIDKNGYYQVYQHLSDNELNSIGITVIQGNRIALSGDGGGLFTAHLHFELAYTADRGNSNTSVNPITKYVEDDYRSGDVNPNPVFKNYVYNSNFKWNYIGTTSDTARWKSHSTTYKRP